MAPPLLQITTKVNYDPNFRFRLWAVISDDFVSIAEGYRLYHGRITSELSSASRIGWSFTNPNGTELNIGALTPDDLYGFLRKSKDAPDGPGRHISSIKVRVLDAYVQYKYPNIYLSLSNASNVHDLAMPNVKFLHGWARLDKIAELASLLTIFSGLHMCMTDEKKAESNSKCYDAVVFSHNLVGVSMHHIAHMPYCVVHEFSMPLEKSFINSDNPISNFIQWESIDNARRRHPRVQIYSGFAIPVSFDLEYKNVSFIAILRDRVIGVPIAREFKLGVGFPYKSDKKYLNYNSKQLSREYFYDISSQDERGTNSLFTSVLYDKALKLHDSLGLEV